MHEMKKQPIEAKHQLLLLEAFLSCRLCLQGFPVPPASCANFSSVVHLVVFEFLCPRPAIKSIRAPSGPHHRISASTSPAKSPCKGSIERNAKWKLPIVLVDGEDGFYFLSPLDVKKINRPPRKKQTRNDMGWRGKPWRVFDI